MSRSMFPTQETPEWVVDEARELIPQLNWQEAKTYRDKAPHEYAMSFKNDQTKLRRLADLIKEYGVTEFFYNTPDKYLYVDEMKYFGWAEPSGFWCINRASAEKYYGNRNG